MSEELRPIAIAVARVAILLDKELPDWSRLVFERTDDGMAVMTVFDRDEVPLQ